MSVRSRKIGQDEAGEVVGSERAPGAGLEVCLVGSGWGRGCSGADCASSFWCSFDRRIRTLCRLIVGCVGFSGLGLVRRRR